MAIGDESASLLFRIRGDSSDARAALRQFRAAASDETDGAAAKMREAFKGIESVVTSLIGSLGRIPTSARAVQSSLSATSAAVADQLKKAQALGQTGAVTARAYEKLNEKITQSQRALQVASAAFAKGEISARQFQQILASTERTVQSVNSRLADSGARLTDFAAKQKDLGSALSSIGDTLASVGAGIRNLGATLTVGITAPITALATLGIRSALELDKARTKLTALEGDSAKASARMQQLFALADSSVGVTRAAAVETFTQLRGISGIAEETINKLIPTIGKLNAAFNIEDQGNFIRNFTQIFQQGFEQQDIKEAIGRIPIFEQFLEQAFGTKDNQKLKQLKESGKLTLNQYLAGMLEAINSNSQIANVSESLSGKIAKGFERLDQALAPVGDIILSIIIPIFESLTPYVQSLSDYFKSLSPAVQTAVVAFGAVAAALGPVLIVIGSVITAIAGIIGGISAAAIAVGGFAILAKVSAVAILAISAVLAQIIPVVIAVGAAVGALYLIWTRNFGGIQELTFSAWERIKTIIDASMTFISETVGSAVSSLVSFWRDNYAQIESAVNRVSENIKTVISAFLAAVSSFWQTHGENIKGYVQTSYAVISGVIKSVLEQIGNFIRLGLAVINKDWNKAWQEFLNILRTTVRLVAQIFGGIFNVVASALKAVVPVIIQYGAIYVSEMTKWAVKAVATVGNILATLPARLIQIIPQIVPALVSAGNQIGSAILEGVRQAFDTSAKAAIQGSFDNIPVVQAGISGDPAFKRATDEQAAESEKARKEREDLAKRDLAAQIELLKRQLADIEKAYDNTFNRLQERLKETGDTTSFQEAFKRAKAEFAAQTDEIAPLLLRLQDEQFAQEKKTANERKILEKEQFALIDEIFAKKVKTQEEADKLVTATAKEEAGKRIKLSEDEAERKIKLAQLVAEKTIIEDEERAERGEISNVTLAQRAAAVRLGALEKERAAVANIIRTEENRVGILQRLADLDNKIARQKLENEKLFLDALGKDAEAEQVIIDRLIERINKEEELERKRRERFAAESEKFTGKPEPIPEVSTFDAIFGDLEGFLEDAVPLKLADMFAEMGRIVTGAFADIGNAIGQTIQQWVLYGETGPAVMRKILASALATISAEAAVNAIYATALGFLRLAQLNYPAAGAAFTSAAIWATIAGVAALAGRAVAGNTFNQNAQSGFNQQAGRATGGQSGGSGNAGEVYTSNTDTQKINLGLNEPQHITWEIVNKTGLSFDDFFEMKVSQNGKTRDVIKKTANG